MTDVEIDGWDFDRSCVYLDIDGKRGEAHFRTEEDGGQRSQEKVDDGAMPVWCWDGDRENPTLSPSIRMFGAHFYIRDGEVVLA